MALHSTVPPFSEPEIPIERGSKTVPKRPGWPQRPGSCVDGVPDPAAQLCRAPGMPWCFGEGAGVEVFQPTCWVDVKLLDDLSGFWFSVL